MTEEDLKRWWELRQQLVNGWHLSDFDRKELVRLNHLVLEASSQIHNKNMMEWF